MPSSPLDVQAKHFTAGRFRAGYQPAEVDAFLAEVDRELQRLRAENAALFDRIASSQPPAEGSTPGPAPAEAPPIEPGIDIVSSSSREDSGSVTLLAEAERQYAEALATAGAERERLLDEAQTRAGQLVGDAEELRETTLRNLNQQKKALERTHQQLLQFEREHRTGMTALMKENLQQLADE